MQSDSLRTMRVVREREATALSQNELSRKSTLALLRDFHGRAVLTSKTSTPGYAVLHPFLNADALTSKRAP